MIRINRAEATFLLSGLGLGASVTALFLAAPFHKMVKDNDEYRDRQMAKIDRMLTDLAPYAPREVLDKILVDFKFDSILTHEDMS